MKTAAKKNTSKATNINPRNSNNSSGLLPKKTGTEIHPKKIETALIYKGQKLSLLFNSLAFDYFIQKSKLLQLGGLRTISSGHLTAMIFAGLQADRFLKEDAAQPYTLKQVDDMVEELLSTRAGIEQLTKLIQEFTSISAMQAFLALNKEPTKKSK